MIGKKTLQIQGGEKKAVLAPSASLNKIKYEDTEKRK